MTEPATAHSPVASSRDYNPLTYADPTPEAASDDYAVVDPAGHVVFRINRRNLLAITSAFDFTKSRRGNSIRAHAKQRQEPAA